MDYELTFRHGYLILDACCAINLASSGEFSSMLAALPIRPAISQHVREQELGAFDLLPFIKCGQLVEVSEQDDAEEETMVNFSAYLGSDGEASTGAIAVARNWAIASDEARVLQFFGYRYPHLQLVTTPELVKLWADIAAPPLQIIQQALIRMREKGKYAVPAAHPLYLWWQSRLEGV